MNVKSISGGMDHSKKLAIANLVAVQEASKQADLRASAMDRALAELLPEITFESPRATPSESWSWNICDDKFVPVQFSNLTSVMTRREISHLGFIYSKVYRVERTGIEVLLEVSWCRRRGHWTRMMLYCHDAEFRSAHGNEARELFIERLRLFHGSLRFLTLVKAKHSEPSTMLRRYGEQVRTFVDHVHQAAFCALAGT